MEEQIVTDRVAENEKLAKAFNEEIETLFLQHNHANSKGNTIFGSKPTALDAHTILFLARLFDKGRGYLIPETLLGYLQHWRGTDEWKLMLPNISTVPDYVK